MTNPQEVWSRTRSGSEPSRKGVGNHLSLVTCPLENQEFTKNVSQQLSNISVICSSLGYTFYSIMSSSMQSSNSNGASS